jgi:uncharacterized membrane protein YhaH (DUF805 family)
MDFTTAVRTCLQKYVDFSGRAPRSEYWWFYLACVLAYIAAAILDGIVRSIMGFGFFAPLVALAMLLPLLAAAVRRLHDLDKPWPWILIGLIPLVGGLVLLYFFVQRGTVGANQFGPDPLPQQAAV